MRAQEAAQLSGHCEGHHEMVTGQTLFQLFSQPLPGFVMLSGGTVTVAAGTKNGNRPQTVITAEDHTAAFRGSASLDRMDDLAVIGRQMGILFSGKLKERELWDD